MSIIVHALIFLPIISIPYKNTYLYNKHDYNLAATFGESWKATPKALKATTRHDHHRFCPLELQCIKLNMLLMIFEVGYT